MGPIAGAVLAGLALGAAASGGAPSPFTSVDARRDACLAQNGTNMGVQVCNERAIAAANRILNQAYAAWVAALKQPAAGDAKDDAEILKRLVAAERAWIVFRDANCGLVSTSMLGGTGEGDAFGQCVYEMTKARVSELETVKASR